MNEINFKEPWGALDNMVSKIEVEAELENEIGPRHPLWKRIVKVIGRSYANDDVALELPDGAYAVIHLSWRGIIDSHPEKYPSTRIFKNATEIQKWLESEFVDE